ncbi:hypothetical protein SPHINGO391_520015 [Sphingomonas aurantiaca]|uniref:Uncharacterized protein n=1 Tax=Sphingomonas aurantiaca TaxID=185949 RepID=A0A5E8AG88_9SPHN|nr:hypothetical protein SPHINGO391_520015 [Sphingomonas aurantiaca]
MSQKVRDDRTVTLSHKAVGCT